MKQTALSTDEAMILQQVYEDGEDDIRSLSYELGMERQAVIQGAVKLERKGLLDFRHSFDGLLLKVSRKGTTMVHSVWPESRVAATW